MFKMIQIALLIIFCSCSSITFTNGKYARQTGAIEKSDNWHHTYVLGLLEYSDPTQLNQICGKGYVWSEVESRKGPIQVLVDLLLPLTIVGNAVYSPWSTRVKCVARI